MTKSRKKHTPKISTFNAGSTEQKQPANTRTAQVHAVKEFSKNTVLPNPYQSLPATGLSRVISKKLPDDMDGIVQYYNHIDVIQATSFVEKCRILAHAHELFKDPDTKEAFKASEGTWAAFLKNIGLSQSQVSRYVSFWNSFGPTILQKAVDEAFSSTKLAELLSWPEDPKPALLDNKRYVTENGKKTIYEMTREELRDVKKMLMDRREQHVIDVPSDQKKASSIRIQFEHNKDPLFVELTKTAEKEAVSPDEIVRRALAAYFKHE